MSGWAAATGPSHHSRAGGLTHEAFRSRDIRCLVPLNVRRIAGTIEEIEHKKNLLPSAIRGAVKEAIEFACYDLEEPIEASLLSANPDGLMDEPGLLHVCVHLVEEAVQLWRRLRVFAIARDFPVLLQSDIASRYLEVSGPARLEEGISLKQTLGRMLRARAVISLTHVNDQLHNRTLNALNAGAITIIEDNKIHREIFSHGENALLFRYNDSSLWEALSLVCSDPERAFRIAEAGFAMRDDPRLRFGKFDNLLALAGR